MLIFVRASYNSERVMEGILPPSNKISPESGFNWPPIKRNMVVLPIPLGPIIAVILPLGTLKLIFLYMTLSPLEKLTSLTSTIDCDKSLSIKMFTSAPILNLFDPIWKKQFVRFCNVRLKHTLRLTHLHLTNT